MTGEGVQPQSAKDTEGNGKETWWVWMMKKAQCHVYVILARNTAATDVRQQPLSTAKVHLFVISSNSEKNLKWEPVEKTTTFHQTDIVDSWQVLRNKTPVFPQRAGDRETPPTNLRQRIRILISLPGFLMQLVDLTLFCSHLMEQQTFVLIKLKKENSNQFINQSKRYSKSFLWRKIDKMWSVSAVILGEVTTLAVGGAQGRKQQTQAQELLCHSEAHSVHGDKEVTKLWLNKEDNTRNHLKLEAILFLCQSLWFNEVLETHDIQAFPRCGNNRTEISKTLKLAANRNEHFYEALVLYSFWKRA